MNSQEIPVYIESGKKKVFAGALDWPGWSRSGRDEETALQALLDHGSRYALVASAAGLPFQVPDNLSGLVVTERLKGTSTTDFGAPGEIPSSDSQVVGEAELHRLQALLEAGWSAFDSAVRAAAGKELRKGPRGGGRDLQAITRHVLGADEGYLRQLGWQVKQGEQGDLARALQETRQAILDGIAAAARGEIAALGPRGGVRWPLRYFARRSLWHLLDHAWEIEDRVIA